MLPNGKGGYSLISPINKKLIEQSLWIPPVSGSRPLPAPTPPPCAGIFAALGSALTRSIRV